jgi:hypothetical protein
MTSVADTPNEVMSDAERTLWEDYHEGYASHVACDRKALTEAFPDLVPEGLRRDAQLVALERGVLWTALTGKPFKKNDWNR